MNLWQITKLKYQSSRIIINDPEKYREANLAVMESKSILTLILRSIPHLTSSSATVSVDLKIQLKY